MILKCLRFLDGLCATWQTIQQGQSPDAFAGRGMVIPEGQIAVALSGQVDVSPWPDFTASYEKLVEKMAEAEGRFPELCRRLQLNHFQLFCMILAVAPQYNRKYERIFAYLQDSIGLHYATLGLAADLYGLVKTLDDETLFAVNDPQLPLNMYGLTMTHSGLSRALTLQSITLTALMGGRALPPVLQEHTTLYWEAEIPALSIHEKEGQRLTRFARACQGHHLVALWGAKGSGRRYLLRHMAAQMGVPLLTISCDGLADLHEETRQSLLEESICWCYHHHGMICLSNFDMIHLAESNRASLRLWLLNRLCNTIPMVCVVGEHSVELPMEVPLLQIELPSCNAGERLVLWNQAVKQCGIAFDQEDDANTLSRVYTLSPGQIQQTVKNSQATALAQGDTTLNREIVSATVRQICSNRLEKLADRMKPSFTWDDLKLEPAAMEQLNQLCNYVRYRKQVFEEWGFESRYPYGRGISACLYGPPGTGKTMSAQVLAREFGLDAYRVDLSRIVDKYIGETEKKLSALFDAAKDSNAILFFDEADVLFSKRSEVSDSKDKYANAETAYLLQRMEQHNGICLLATNYMQNFDKAFRRRITFMVPVEMPSTETRLILWKAAFPPDVPLSPYMDLETLSKRAELAGSAIKNIALAASYAAAVDGTPVTMDHIYQCAVVEFAKHGSMKTVYDFM